MSDNIITQIRTQYEFFTNVEKRIADLILKDPQEFVTYSTAKAAKLCNVSQGSINNFADKLISAGFSFLKLEIARCVTLEQGVQINTENKKSGAHMRIMERKLRQNISALCNTFEINNEDSLKKAVSIILSANKIEIFAVFQSGIVAKDLHFNLIKLGRPSNYLSDSLMFAVCAAMLSDMDVVIAISSSGTTKEVIDAANIAKSNGARVICITTNKFSPLAKLSDVVLLTTAGHGANDGVLARRRISQFLVTDSLCGYIEIYEKLSREKITEIDKIINSHSVD